MFAFLDDSLVGDKYAAIELGCKVANEFFAALHVFIHKDVFEFVKEWFFE